MQGEGGTNPAEKDFLAGIWQLCDEHKILMISDEIRCGMGGSEEMFAYCATREDTAVSISSLWAVTRITGEIRL